MVDLTHRHSFDADLALGDQIRVPSIRRIALAHVRAMVDAFNRYDFVILACEDRTRVHVAIPPGT